METMDKEVKDKQLVESDEILITKKDLRKVFLNSMTIMCSWNYERQMHMGFMFGMAPIIDKLYKNNEKEKRAAYKRHMEFFNCTPQMTSFIMGLSASMEEQNAKSNGEFNAESISMIKTSLMGPFAGIGDSFFQGTLRIITFGIGLSFAKQGSILGPILAVGLFAIPSLLTAYYGTFLGYKSGNNYLAKIYQEGLMDRIMQFASIIGLAVVGGMVASMVPISTPIEFTTGGTQLVLQDMIDSILPKFLPLVSTMGIYWLIKKKVNTNILLFGIIILGMVLSLLGVL
ncbi:MAG: PTS system mannose/fructose/sorbose family transporter subunit IID [Clostridium sp.]|uniref:PTS system mannose/fructose/sorbose family transporter subunit IID n=1 Tax=Clostridium TaxID=1485 RepID=UPI0026EFF599|nr:MULTISPECIES: PTS system mannose/fructose/sorbose family transporter subunit IID [Clostridium]MDU2283480.1 PTS system mannose/fructose/sorbose family transporter subunit IID [Clostridium sp.]MDU6808591.1 PTS system mannose/fructose/sorbose family transporter subunit IID [Clostridium sp.]